MKRWVFPILICLVLGVVTTVGVASGFAICVQELGSEKRGSRSRTTLVFPVDGDAIEIELIIDVGSERITTLNGSIRGFGFSGSGHPAQSASDTVVPPAWCISEISNWNTTKSDEPFKFSSLTLEARGWPTVALYCSPAGQSPNTRSPPAGGWVWPFAETTRRSILTTLPLRPIFPGFLINTLFYATIWFILIFGWRMHLRQVRKWQGYCPMCKYDLRGQEWYHHAPRGSGDREGELESGGPGGPAHSESGGTSPPNTIGCPECGWGRGRRRSTAAGG